MNDPKLDWDLLEWVKPYDHEILRYSRGEPLDEYALGAYQHVNWAYKELGMACVVNCRGGDPNAAFGALVAYCQQYVKEHNLKELKVAPVKSKKKGWFW